MGAGWYFVIGCATALIGIIYDEIKAYKIRQRTGEPAPKPEKPPKERHTCGEIFTAIVGAMIITDLLSDKD